MVKNMDPNVMKAKLFLEVILPHIETLIEIDPQVAKLVKGWNNVIQFEVKNGGPSGYLEFTGGNLKVKQGVHGKPTVLFLFDSVDKFCAMIDGTSKPMPKKGMIHLFLLVKFMKLTAILEKTLKPDEAWKSDPAKLRRTVTLMLNTAMSGMKVIAENDPQVAPTVAQVYDGEATLGVLPDGPFASVRVKNKAFTPIKGKVDSPFFNLDVIDLPTAFQMMNNEIDTFAYIGSGDIALHGYLPFFGDLNYIMSKISGYLQPPEATAK